MKYDTGTVAVTNGSQIVTGTGTKWLTNAAAGDIFTILNSNVWYQIASVDSDTQIHLSANYAGTTATGQQYDIHRSFTTNYDLPYPQQGDVQVAAILTRAITMIDAQIKAIADSIGSASSLLDTLGSAQGDVIYRGAVGWGVLPPGTAGYFLKTGGTGANVSWAQALIPTNNLSELSNKATARATLGAAASGANTDITSLGGLTTPLSVSQGGMGSGTHTAHGVLVGNGTGAVAATAAGTAGQPLLSGGAGADPAYGTLGTAAGGTGSTSGGVMQSAIGYMIDGGGAAITAGHKAYIEVPFNCTINVGTLLADQTGSIVVELRKCTYAQFDSGATHPVTADKINATAPLTISAAKKAQDATLTGWTKTFAQGDILEVYVNSASSVTQVLVSLRVTKT